MFLLHCIMKIAFLGIDVNRASCDPDLYFKKGTFEHSNAQHLDKTAQNIADFIDDARDFVESVGWAMQYADTRPGQEQDYTPEECAFHRVRPIPTEDDFLPKTRMSPYEEHKVYFDRLKEDGVDTIVLTGVYAEHCIYWTLDDLMSNGFKVIVPMDLVAAMTPHNPMYSLTDFSREAYEGKVIFTDSEKTLDMLYEDETKRKPPRERYTWNDIHQANFDTLGM